MVDFVRPNFLGTQKEFSNLFERPIANGQCVDSTPRDKRVMMHRSHVLTGLLKGFVQRRSHRILQAQMMMLLSQSNDFSFNYFNRCLYRPSTSTFSFCG